MDAILTSAGFSTITKLKGVSNYTLWKFEVKIFLEAAKVYNVAVGNDAKPLLDADKLKTWNESDAMARKIIVTTIDKSLLTHILTCTYAHEMWSTLKNLFGKSTEQEKSALYQEFFGLNFIKNGNVVTYVSKLETLFVQLKGLEAGIKDEMLINKILQGLPDSYRSFKTGWDFLPVGNKTLETLKSKLLAEHNREKAVKTEEPVAFLGKEKRTCHRCKRAGHISRYCRVNIDKNNDRSENNKYDKSVNRGDSNRQCGICKKTNHDESQCFFRNKNDNKNNSGKNPKPDKNVAFVAHGGENEYCEDIWVFDSGCTSHLTNKINIMTSVKNVNTRVSSAKEGVDIQIEAMGKVITDKCELNDVLYSPDICTNLISINCIIKNGGTVNFSEKGIVVLMNNYPVMHGKRDKNGLFVVTLKSVLQNTAFFVSKTEDLTLWHRRLGHLSIENIKKLTTMSEGLHFSKNQFNKLKLICDVCPKAKQTRASFGKMRTPATRLLEIIHTDVCGKISPPAWSNDEEYFVTFRDDFSGFTCLYLLKNKSEVFDTIKTYVAFAERKHNLRVGKLRLDNGGEYSSTEMKDWCQTKGIELGYTPANTPSLNGESERLNRTLVEKVRAMLFNSKLNKEMWGEAARVAAYLVNRSPKSGSEKTPYEIWHGKTPDLKNLRVFGSRVFAKTTTYLKKLDSRSKEYIFVGYAEHGYRLFDPIDSRMIISRDVIFRENETIKLLNNADNEVRILLDHEPTNAIRPEADSQEEEEDRRKKTQDKGGEEDTTESEESTADDSNASLWEPSGEETNQTVLEIDHDGKRYPDRDRAPVCRYPDPENRALYAQYASVFADAEPVTVHEAMNSENATEWTKAMSDEYQSLIKNKTWVLVDPPSNKPIVRNKWVFKIKRGPNGEISRYKCRLVAKGYSQIEGVNYHETFSPVVRHSTLRMLFALAVEFNLKLEHLDVDTAFLNGEIEEEIYMYQPESFEDKSQKHKVCLLKKAIYGLKQASHAWNKRANEVITSLGLQKSRLEPCVYFSRSKNGIFILAIYVDDFFLFYSDHAMKDKVKKGLMDAFKIKDLGKPKQILGMNVHVDEKKGEVKFDQEIYINQILRRFHMEDCKPVGTPIIKKGKEDENEDKNKKGEINTDIPYQQLIGSLMYLSVCTRPDISYAISYLSQFNKNPTNEMWQQAKRVLRYLKGTKEKGLLYKKSENSDVIVFTGFIDADWAGNLENGKSYTGYVYKINNNTVSWEARKQKTVALSSTESEYYAVSESGKEGLFLTNLFTEIFNEKFNLKLINDNQSEIKLHKNPKFHSRTKHIAVRHHFLRDLIQEKVLSLEYLPTEEMVADMLTKPLTPAKHMFCLNKILT